MKTIRVEASRCYEVHIGSGLLTRLGEEVRKAVSGRTAAVISDGNVWPLYGQTARSSLESSGFSVCSFVFPSGENSKSIDNFTKILNFFSDNGLQRSDCVIALGGGVTGDLAGFASACYLRGISYIQVPTSLLSAVDSSVGGKTAINLPTGKNLCGAFHQPHLVLCDTDMLCTLPQTVFRDGCAEIIKYAVLFDPELFAHLESYGMEFDRECVIARCVEWKARLVQADEFDTDQRRLLNLGHTVGHAIEAESAYTLSHGQAVAMGIAAVTKSAVSRMHCSANDGKRIFSLLKQFRLPCRSDYTPEVLLPHMILDKKAESNEIHMIIPQRIGQCTILPMQQDLLMDFLKAGL